MGAVFPWGEITRVHDIAGRYEIIEYVSGPAWEDAGETCYSVAGGSYETLEQAMLACVCGAYSQDSSLFEYAFRLIAGVVK